MLVKELVEKLLSLDQEAVVIKRSDNFELNGAEVPVSHLYETKTGSIEKKTFRDAFDGESYQTNVYSIFDGDLSLVVIS